MDWESLPVMPQLEQGNIPLYDYIDWLKSLPGHPEPLTPHHPQLTASDGIDKATGFPLPRCNECGTQHEPGPCPNMEGGSYEMPELHTAAEYPPPNGTHACPHCGQGMISNGWTGWTPYTNGTPGQRSWQCPNCQTDMRPVENRPVQSA